jgi:hypothetical protein
MFKDSPEALRRAALYLEEHSVNAPASAQAWLLEQHATYHPKGDA